MVQRAQRGRGGAEDEVMMQQSIRCRGSSVHHIFTRLSELLSMLILVTSKFGNRRNQVEVTK